MDFINVLVISSISEESLRQIAAVSPKINLSNASDLWDSPDMVTAERKGDFSNEKFDALLAQAEVLYGFRPPRNLVARAPKLKWIQATVAGVDHFLDTDIVQSPVIVTNTRGIHSQVSELTLEMMLMFAKRASFCFQLKQAKRWEPFTPEVLHAKTLGILGLGNIGQEVARLAKAFHMRVVATKVRQVRSRYVDVVLPPERLRELLSESDFVVITLPFTPQTNKLLGEAELRAMKPTAYLINVARGGIVDDDVLIRALSENWIAGAGLDVLSKEPPEALNPLLHMPNVIVSPHSAFMSHEAEEEVRFRSTKAVIDALEDRIPEDIINPEIFKKGK